MFARFLRAEEPKEIFLIWAHAMAGIAPKTHRNEAADEDFSTELHIPHRLFHKGSGDAHIRISTHLIPIVPQLRLSIIRVTRLSSPSASFRCTRTIFRAFVAISPKDFPPFGSWLNPIDDMGCFIECTYFFDVFYQARQFTTARPLIVVLAHRMAGRCLSVD